MSLLRHPLSIAAASSLLGSAALLHAQEPATDIPAPELPADAPPLPPGTPEPVLPDAPPAAAPAAAGPSTNVTVNLIARLVQKGILTQEEAQILIAQAEQDAARAQAAQAAQAATVAAVPLPLDPITGVPAGQETRVTYIPDNVRNEMRAQISQELMAQAREENWGAQDVPEWTRKVRLFGDIRSRYESVDFGDGNFVKDPYFTNFNAINSGSPYDIANTSLQLPSLYNVDQDRERMRLRARAGAEIMLGDGFNAGIRLATGENNSPVSPNQTLGAGGGNFSKYSIWLDRAFLSWDMGPRNGDGEELTFFVGRFDNPFFSTEVQWDDDIGFDGIAARGRVNLRDGLSTFFTGGLFPIYNTDFNFSSNQTEKFKSTDRWLYAAQAGIEWKIDDDWKFKAGLAYYDFREVQGEFSTPYVPLSASDEGDTDSRRIISGQRGNTRMPLRHILLTPANSSTTSSGGTIVTNQWQYYGLASEFRNLTLTGRLDYEGYEEIKFALTGEITKNLGFDKSEVIKNAYAAGRHGRTLETQDSFSGGDIAWNLSLQAGNPAMDKKGDWLASIGYRYVESDAVLDGFTDSDFGGGGTNLRGLTLGAAYALSPNVRIGAKWMSADEIDGPPLSTDTLQFDISAKF